MEPTIQLTEAQSWGERAWHERTDELLKATKAERLAQLAKWGKQNHDFATWAIVIGEEYGELCQAIWSLKFGTGTVAEIRTEAIQVAASALALVHCLEDGEA